MPESIALTKDNNNQYVLSLIVNSEHLIEIIENFSINLLTVLSSLKSSIQIKKQSMFD
jgi:hypothetical protein